MSVDNRLAIYETIKQWIKNENNSAYDFDEDTEIFNARILDSIQMLSLVLFVEELIGKQIPDEKLMPEYFKTINIIYNEFFV